MRTTPQRVAAIATVGLLAALVSCGSSAPSKADVAACKSAMTKQLAKSLETPAPTAPGTRPTACKGVDAKTLNHLVGEIMNKELGG